MARLAPLLAVVWLFAAAGCSSAGPFTVIVEGSVEADLSGGEAFYEEFLSAGGIDRVAHLWFQSSGPGETFWVVDVTVPAEVVAGDYPLRSPLLLRPGSPSLPPDRFEAALYVTTGEESPIFDQDVTGRLIITASGATLSGSFEFVAFEGVPAPGGGMGAGTRSVTVKGSFREIPLAVLP